MTSPKVLYVAGPMTGLPKLNFPAFDDAEGLLTDAGYAVLNPTRHGSGDPGKTWIDYLIPCLHDVMNADGIALLAGWRASKGARVEHRLAEVHGKPTLPVNVWLTRESLDPPRIPDVLRVDHSAAEPTCPACHRLRDELDHTRSQLVTALADLRAARGWC